MIINPGSGPVAAGSETDARANMAHLAADVAAATGTTVEAPDACTGMYEGRYTFTLTVNGTDHEVDMPGLPLTRVRYIQAEGQDPFDFPRLYVDGSSWTWIFAVQVLARPVSDNLDD